MPGFSNVTGLESIMFADNASFDGTQRDGAMTTDGELWIGNGSLPHVRLGEITSPGGSVTVGYSSPDITLEVAASVALSFVTDSGTATPAANILNVLGDHGLNTTGSGDTVTVLIDNSITLGDLSTIASGSDALTCTTGDITITSGNLNMPDTVSGGADGVIEFGGTRFVSNLGTNNTFVGENSGNTSLSGGNNTGHGYQAGLSLTSGNNNTFVGSTAGDGVTTNVFNTAVGSGALSAANPDRCTAMGYNALNLFTGVQATAFGTSAAASLVSGTEVVAIGYRALTACTGSFNVAMGHNSGASLTSGLRNTSIGSKSHIFLATGSNNIALGYEAGLSYTTTEAGNINIGNYGVIGDSLAIRIGDIGGTHPAQQTSCYIAGIKGVAVSTPQSVTINSSTGQLGSTIGTIVNTTLVTVAGPTQMEVDNLYVAFNNSSLVVLTLPTLCAIGTVIKVIGRGSAGWSIAQNAGEQILSTAASTTTGTGGSLASGGRYDCVTLRCILADNQWVVENSEGTLVFT